MTTRAVPLGALPHIVADETMSRSELRAILHATFHKLALYEGCGSQRKAHEWIRERIPAKDWPFVKTLLPVPKKTGRGKLQKFTWDQCLQKGLRNI